MSTSIVRMISLALVYLASVSADSLPSAVQLRSCTQLLASGTCSAPASSTARLLGGALDARLARSSLRLRGGAKSKNHTNHNQSSKAHRNGIKRVKT